MATASRVERWTLVAALVSLVISVFAVVKPAPVQDWIDARLGALVVPNDNDVPYPGQRIEVTTSGYLVDNDGDIWSGGNLVDGDPRTGWSECATRDEAKLESEGRFPCEEPDDGADVDERCADREAFAGDPVVQGIGEWVEFTFPSEVDLKEIHLRNGLQQSDQVFLRNPRVARLSVLVDGRPFPDLELANRKELQRFPLETRATTIRLTIEATHLGDCIQGKKADGRLGYFYDTSLSEVAFIPRKVPD